MTDEISPDVQQILNMESHEINLVYFQVEGFGDEGTALALYFDGTPSERNVKAGYKKYLGTNNEYNPEWEIVESPLSKIANLTRVLIYNYS